MIPDKKKICVPTLPFIADKCVRSQLPIFLNDTPLRILQKIYTHSYKGFTNLLLKIIRWNVWCRTAMYANHNGSFNLLSLRYILCYIV